MQQQEGRIGSNDIVNEGKNASARAILIKLHSPHQDGLTIELSEMSASASYH
jgi:hypothetical protein